MHLVRVRTRARGQNTNCQQRAHDLVTHARTQRHTRVTPPVHTHTHMHTRTRMRIRTFVQSLSLVLGSELLAASVGENSQVPLRTSSTGMTWSSACSTRNVFYQNCICNVRCFTTRHMLLLFVWKNTPGGQYSLQYRKCGQIQCNSAPRRGRTRLGRSSMAQSCGVSVLVHLPGEHARRA